MTEKLVTVRDVHAADLPVVWTLATLPNIGPTADPTMPVPLPPASAPPPGEHGDIGDPEQRFVAAGGCLLVAESGGHIVGMGGLRPRPERPERAEVLRVRVHPARRRLGVGRALMSALEARARAIGCTETWLDTATNQPEAVAFYRGLGYTEIGRETRPEWAWTLVYFRKPLAGDQP